MKKLCSAIILLATMLVHSPGSSAGYLAFMNAVGLTTKTDVRIDGHSLKPAGFPEGNYVESFGLPAGPHQFVFTNAGLPPLAQTITVGDARAPLYILYTAPVPQKDGTIKYVLKLLTIPGQAPAQSQRRFLGLYASDRPSTTVTLNGAATSLPSGRPVILSGPSLDVATDSGQPMRYAPSRPGNYIIVFFDGSDSRLHQAMLQME